MTRRGSAGKGVCSVRKFDNVRATHVESGSVLLGQYWGDDGTSAEPPGNINLKLKGFTAKDSIIQLKAHEWLLERVLPTTPGSLVETEQGLFVLIGGKDSHKQWHNVVHSGPGSVDPNKPHVVHFDAAMKAAWDGS